MESSAEVGRGARGGKSLALARLEVAVAAVIAAGGAALYLAMPALIEEGGIREAQEFVKLSPIFFPRMTFALLSALGFLYLAASLQQLPAAGGGRVFGEEGALARVAAMFGFALAYPLLLPWAGYGFTSVLVLAGMTVVLGNRVWWEVVAFVLLAPVAIRFVFERLLKISLPRADFEALEAVEEALMQALTKVVLSL